MKTISLFLSICCVLFVLGEPIKSNIGAREILTSQQKETDPYTASDYIQTGIVALWDSIENISYGVHSNEATSWVDIVSGMELTFIDSASYNRTYYWSETALVMDGYRTDKVQYTVDSVKEALASDCTIELIAEIGMNMGSVSTLFAYGADSSAGFLARNVYTHNSGHDTAVFNNNFLWRFARPTLKYYSCGGNDEYWLLHDTITINGNIAKHYYIGTDGSIHTDTWTAVSGNPNSKLAEILSCNKAKLYGCRIYNRALSDTEVMRNYSIDKDRFGL